MFGVLIALIGTLRFVTTSGTIKVTLVDSTRVERTKEVIKESYKNINVEVSGTEDIRIRSVSGDIRVTNNRTSGKYPRYISIKTISGDVKLRGWIPTEVDIKTTSGDIDVSKTSVVTGKGLLKITTVSGDISIECPPFPIKVITVSGDVDLYIPSESNVDVDDTIFVVSGELEIEYNGKTYRLEGDTTVQLGKRKITLRKGSSVSEVPRYLEKTLKLEPNIYLFQPFTHRSAWGDIGSIRSISIHYNRVDGPGIGLSVYEFSHDRNINNIMMLVKLNVGIDFRFGRKIPGINNRWVNTLGYNGDIEIGTGVGTSLKEAKILSIVLDGWINETSTHDLWLIKDYENTLSAILFKYDFYDYFLSSSWGAGIKLRVGRTFTAQLGYRYMTLDSLPVTQDFSIFNRDKEFRENPGVDIFKVQGLEFRLGFRIPHIDAAIRVFRNNKNTNFTQTLATISGKWDTDFGKFMARLTGGNSTTLRPFVFGIGGIGTLPAYNFKEFKTRKFVLLNTDFIAPTEWVSGIAFVDFAWIPGIQVQSDIGLGIAFGGFSVRVATKLRNTKEYKVYLRFKERF